MNAERPIIGGKIRLLAPLVCLTVMLTAGCGGTGGAWLWWLLDPEVEVDAEYALGKGRLVILIDDDKGWLKDPAIRPLLTRALIEQFKTNEINAHVVPPDKVDRLRRRDPKFDRRGAREVGQKLKAEQVLHINVRLFTLHHEMAVDPAYQGKFVVNVKILDVSATKPEDVRLWPRSSEGKRIEAGTELHTAKSSGYDDKLTRRMCNETADKIAKLFYDHKVKKEL